MAKSSVVRSADEKLSLASFSAHWMSASTIGEAGVWALALMGGLLWWLGYPRPHVDDLFFTGASVELAHSGRLLNPWLSVWSASLGSDKFYAFPPVLPCAQALWIVGFGVSTAGFTAFHILVQTALEICVFQLVRATGGNRVLALCAAGVTALFPLTYGMRPDALALLLVVLGQRMAISNEKWHWAAGAFLSAAAVLTHPLAMAFVVPLYGMRFLVLRSTPTRIPQWFVFTVFGVAVAFAAFLVAIQGELVEFLRAISLHRQLATAPRWYMGPFYFWREMTFGKEVWLQGPIFLLILAGIIPAFCGRSPSQRSQSVRRLYAVWLVSLILGCFLYAGRMAHYAAYAGLVLAIVSWAESRWRHVFAVSALAAVVLNNAGALLTPIFGDNARPDVTTIRQAVHEHPGKTLCLDEVVARYVYDFRLPPGAQDWGLRNPAGIGAAGTVAAKPTNELWIASEWKIERYISDSGVKAERLRIGSHVFNSQPKSPYRLVIVK
ncbi:hypothetical protein K0B96_07700 [Horticoccus luteus]|uniref:Uncharacterized protein n=1 Tax=Horticoccus luteus TaxID=2862869 RepID=A0A8F9TYH5_9BACT|nr:hypothetical protein [Horticoccus luteus]QYM80480.1 hypothetical protein K0B96_07700 [Horticoccus luteus]